MGASLRIMVPGEPVAWERVGDRIITPAGKKPIVTHYTPKQTAAYEKHVRTIAKLEANRTRWTLPHQDAKKKPRYRLIVRVFRTYEGKGGDLDNYLKSIKDGLNKVAWLDDRYVREIGAVLRQDKVRPRVEIVVEELEAA